MDKSNIKPDTPHSGLLAGIRDHTPEFITENATQLVAGMKLAGAGSMLLSKNLAFQTAGILQGIGYTIIATFGHKKTEAEKEALREESSSNTVFHKILQPHKYPIESGTAFDTASDVLWTVAGIKKNGEISASHISSGLLNLISDTNLLLSKEDRSEDANSHSKGSVPYYATELKNRPVLASSIINAGADLAAVAGGAHDYFVEGKNLDLLIAGGFTLAADTIQALYVDKNDYNIEKEEDTAKPSTNLSAERHKAEPIAATELTQSR